MIIGKGTLCGESTDTTVVTELDVNWTIIRNERDQDHKRCGRFCEWDLED